MLRKTIFITLIMLLIVAMPIQAQIMIVPVNEGPPLPGYEYSQAPYSVAENVYNEVFKEVYALEKKAPFLESVNWTVYVADKYVYNNGEFMYGIASSGLNAAFIFSADKDIKDTVDTVDHEILHLVRYNYLPIERLNKEFKGSEEYFVWCATDNWEWVNKVVYGQTR